MGTGITQENVKLGPAVRSETVFRVLELFMSNQLLISRPRRHRKERERERDRER